MGNLDGGSVDAADFEGRDGTIDLARPLAAQNERGSGRREEGNRHRRRGMAENAWQRPRAPALSARALAYGSTQAMGRAANLFR
jgi:hypothetical protein